MEEWRDVIGYEAYFQISDLGRLYSKRTSRILSQTVSENGYYVHATKIGGRKGKSVCFKIHRLVCEAFHPNPENKPTVNHKDGNKLNNAKDNVEWSSHQENTQHAYDTGLAKVASGENHASSKLTEALVTEIREEYKNTKISQRALAAKYGVGKTTIQNVLTGETWNNSV